MSELWRYRSARIALLALFLFLATISVARADGIIIPRPPVPPRPSEPVASLAIRYHRVTVTISGQVATTEVDQVFVNELPYELEGTYMFPLPEGAAISDFAMFVDDRKVEGRLLDQDEARRVYEEIVREQKDPALLQYVGRNAFQARIYPIAAHGEKRVIIRYSEVLGAEAGLVRYLYPLDTERFSSKPIEDVSIHVELRTEQPLRALYSPSHTVAVEREGDYHATISYEDHDVKPDRDLELYYSVADDDVDVSLLSYREAGEDGFFLLLVSPKVAAEGAEIVAKDVVIVLDVSGSMRGAKMQQAKDALAYILDHLHDEDRFNIVAFSSGTRRYAATLCPASEREEAHRFVRELEAAGGTNINRALLEALELLSGGERPQIILFLTDGLATEGVVATQEILTNVRDTAPRAARLFTFGVGDEVNTILLDTIAQEHRGASAYVRPNQSIAEVVSAFYAKVGTPLLTDVSLDLGGALVEDIYPYPLPDLFAGSQLVVAGRYRQGGAITVTLRGQVNERPTMYTYPGLHLVDRGGESFIPRLWATRKIGYLLNEIRLRGEDRELVDEIVALSVRYGIMTPYTAFLVDENEDVLTREGREEVAFRMSEAAQAPAPAYGAKAVENSIGQRTLQDSEVAPAAQATEIKHVRDVSFILRNGVWIDTRYDPDKATTVKLRFGSDAYFALLAAHPEWGAYLSVGPRVIALLDGVFYEVSETEGATDTPMPAATVATTTAPVATATPRASPVVAPTATPLAPSILTRLLQWLRGLK